MIFIALKMLLGDRTKYAGLLFGISFTSFLVTFAASYFGGMMTRSFALIADNPAAELWVMDPAVVAIDRPIKNSEDVGDAVTMLSIAMLVGFGVTGVMMFMFTNENLKYYGRSKLEPFHFLGAQRLFPFTIYHLAVLFDRPAVFCVAIPGAQPEGLRVCSSTIFTPDSGVDR